MRNSSLVKWFCAENVTGLKHATEAANARKCVVGEHSASVKVKREHWLETAEERMPERVAIKRVKRPLAVSLRFPGEG